MLAAGALLLATPSCKKGENDPFLSLSSRKGRVAGDYTISAYESASSYTNSTGTNSTTETMAGNTITETSTWTPSGGGSSTTTTTTTTVNLGEFSFDKEGTFTMTWNTTSVEVDVQTIGSYTSTTTTTTTSTSMQSGSWNFLGKVDEYKNKERLVLNVLSSHVTNVEDEVNVLTDGSGGSVTTTTKGDLTDNTYGYSDGEVSNVYEIDQLKGKEMIFKQVGGGSNIYKVTDNSGSTAVTTSSTASDTFSSSWTLTQK